MTIHMKMNWTGCGSAIRNVPAVEIRQTEKIYLSQTARVGMIPSFFFPIPAGTELKILGEPSPKLVLNIQEIPPGQGRREEAARLLRPLLNRDTVRRLLIVQAVIPEKNGEKQAFLKSSVWLPL